MRILPRVRGFLVPTVNQNAKKNFLYSERQRDSDKEKSLTFLLNSDFPKSFLLVFFFQTNKKSLKYIYTINQRRVHVN